MFVVPVNTFEGGIKDFKLLQQCNAIKNLFSPIRKRKLNRFLFWLHFPILGLVQANAVFGKINFFGRLFSFSFFTIFQRLFNFLYFSF